MLKQQAKSKCRSSLKSFRLKTEIDSARPEPLLPQPGMLTFAHRQNKSLERRRAADVAMEALAGRGEPRLSVSWREAMRRAIGIALAAAYFAAGTSLAMAQNGPPTGGYPPAAGGANSYPGLVSPYYGNYNYAAPYAGGTYYNYAAPYAAGTYYDYAGPYAAGTYPDFAAPYVVAPSYGYATPYYGTYNYAAPYYGAPGPVYSYGYFGPRWR